jgi:hypothetical protein
VKDLGSVGGEEILGEVLADADPATEFAEFLDLVRCHTDVGLEEVTKSVVGRGERVDDVVGGFVEDEASLLVVCNERILPTVSRRVRLYLLGSSELARLFTHSPIKSLSLPHTLA